MQLEHEKCLEIIFLSNVHIEPTLVGRGLQPLATPQLPLNIPLHTHTSKCAFLQLSTHALRTDRRTDGPTDRRTDGHDKASYRFACPQLKTMLSSTIEPILPCPSHIPTQISHRPSRYTLSNTPALPQTKSVMNNSPVQFFFSAGFLFTPS